VATYYDLVPAFQQLLQENNGDLERFYKQVRSLSKLPKDERFSTREIHTLSAPRPAFAAALEDL
jgi:predicted aminopeptidase